MSKKWIAAIAIYLGLLTVCLVVLYAVPSVRGILEKTYIAEYGELDVKDEVSAFIVRDERVYLANQSSDVNRLIEEGKLVKAASAVVELTPREGDASTVDSGSYEDIVRELGESAKITEKGYTTESGYVSYSVDGAEAALTTDGMEELTKEDFEALTDRRSKDTPKSRCRRGEPVFKIVKNGRWFLVYYTDKENGARYNEGSYIYMNVADEDIRVQVYRVEEIGEGTRVILECKSFFEGFLDTRVLETTVTLKSAEGLILQEDSLVERGDQVGVFVKNKIGEHVYKPVQIIASDEGKCVAYSDIYLDADGNFVETIGTYDEIIENPSEDDLKSIGVKPKKEKEESADSEDNKEPKDDDNQ